MPDFRTSPALLVEDLKKLSEDLDHAVQSDNEQGAHWLNNLHSAEFNRQHPELVKWLSQFRTLCEKHGIQ
jgi:hypothetical protein